MADSNRVACLGPEEESIKVKRCSISGKLIAKVWTYGKGRYLPKDSIYKTAELNKRDFKTVQKKYQKLLNDNAPDPDKSSA
jgi:hypothetical protein